MNNGESGSPEGVQSDAIGALEAASLLGAHVETLRRMARKGLVPAYKLEKDWRFSRKALSSWMESHHLRERPPLVLVVDDEKSIRETVRMFLEEDGCRVAVAEDGAGAMELARREMPDVALLDLVMPGMSGVDVLKELHALNPDLPVVIVTGHPDSALMAEALLYPPITLLPKPVNGKVVQKTVRMVVKGARSR